MEAILRSAAGFQDAIVQTRQGGLGFHRPSIPNSVALSCPGRFWLPLLPFWLSSRVRSSLPGEKPLQTSTRTACDCRPT